jgi:hypothetical protein
MYVRPPNADVVISMDKLSPSQRDQFVQIKTKTMQIEVEHEQAVAQMDMKYQKSMMEMQRQLMELFPGLVKADRRYVAFDEKARHTCRTSAGI